MLHSYERRETSPRSPAERGALLRRTASRWQLTVGDLQDNLSDTDVDRVILDMLAPGSA